MINTRAEPVAEKPTLRNILKRHRCLVLANGYCQWQETLAGKTPCGISMKSAEPFAMAGLWETWRDSQGNVAPSCMIITATASYYLAPIHNRMAVIPPWALEELWLETDIEDRAALAQILVPSPDDGLDAYEVSTLTNYHQNEGREVIARVAN